jgi:hypothetical protein
MLTAERYRRRARSSSSAPGRSSARAFEHEFEGGPAWPVFDALARFQNPDGGFGHGLEPDALTGASGALATSVALHRLAEVGAAADHPMVRAAVGYLQRTIDPTTRVWRIVPEATADAPHAPWWAAGRPRGALPRVRAQPQGRHRRAALHAGPAADEGWLDGSRRTSCARSRRGRGRASRCTT